MKKVLVFIFITITIVIAINYSWFSEGKIIANGSEENFNIFRSQKTADYSSSFWYPGGTGYKSGFNIGGYPVFSLLGFLENKDVPAFLRQGILLGALMIVGILSMSLLLHFGLRVNYLITFVGSFFYLFNIYSMTQIWKRFLYNGMFAWAYLPLFVFLWIKWLERANFAWLLIFSLSTFFFSSTFAPPTFLFAIWTPAIIFSIVLSWQNRKEKKQLFKIILLSVIGFTAWAVANFWWFYPAMTLSRGYASEAIGGIKIDFDSLRAVSQYFPAWEVALLRQGWYLGPENDWNNFYHNPVVILINIGVFLIAFYGMIKSKGQKYRSFLLSLGFIGFFVSKGTNFPLGHTFFYWLFSLFPITTALRNSYEKFGLVWLLPYAIFFAIGFHKFIIRFQLKARLLYSAILLILFLVILVYPMWSGVIFPPKHRIAVPSYYIEANNYLKNLAGWSVPNRVFHIPYFLQLDRLKYTWGFAGVDPTDSLFDFESATIPKIPLYMNFYERFPLYWEINRFPRILGFFGIEYIISHRDSIYPKIDLNKLEQSITSWEGVASKKEFGPLEVYALEKSLVKPRIYATTSVINISDTDKIIEFILNGSYDPEKNEVFMDTGRIKLDLGQNNAEAIKIDFRKISNDHYEVKLKDITGPYILVLNNTFDNAWQLKIDGQFIDKHFIVNGFANGWSIDKKGDYTADVKLAVWPWEVVKAL